MTPDDRSASIAPHATVPTGRAYFPWLDALRGFAACSVIVYHLITLAKLPLPTTLPWRWFSVGFLGVDLFFAISGAVILLALDAALKREPQHWRQTFVRHRLARILPLYVVTCIVFVAFVKPDILQRADIARLLLAQALFVHNLSSTTHGVINGPSWTLGLEMQFYAAMALGGAWLLSVRGRWIAVLLCGVAIGWRALVWWLDAGSHPDTPGALEFIHATQLPGVIDAFAAGMLAALWLQHRRAQGAQAQRATALLLALFAFACWGIVLAGLTAYAADYWMNPVSAIGLRSLTAVAGGLSVAAAFAAPEPRFARAAMTLAGDLSYGLYLWHLPVLLWLQTHWPDATPWRIAAAVFALTIALSLLSWFALERPILRWARRRDPAATA